MLTMNRCAERLNGLYELKPHILHCQNGVSVGQNTGMTNYPNYVEAVRKTLKFTYFQNYSSI